MRNFIIILHNVISATESRRMRWTGYVHLIFFRKSAGKRPYGDLEAERMTILKHISTV
jgi:hypothetical protein